MRLLNKYLKSVPALLILIFHFNVILAQNDNYLSDFKFNKQPDIISEIKSLDYDFKGYTSHWDKFSWNWYSYNGIFLSSQPSMESEIWQLEMDIGNQLLLDELWIQKGFVFNLAERDLPILKSPSEQEMKNNLNRGDILIVAQDHNPVVQKLVQKLPEDLQFRRNRAFYLNQGEQTLFIIASHTQSEVERLFRHIEQAKNIIKNYNLYKGLAGVHSNNLLITPSYHHNPYTLINKAIQIGCSWVMVSGYNDWMIPPEVNNALNKIDFPFVFLPGQYGTGGIMYGMERYPNIQNNTLEECLNWTAEKNGYYFSHLSNVNNELNRRFHGYIIAGPGDQVKRDSLDTPFITNAGTIRIAVPPTMLLFIDKNQKLSEEKIWHAILNKDAVALFGQGKMIGPRELCDPLKILFLEREFLASQFKDQIFLNASIEGNELIITVHNRMDKKISGTLKFQVSPGVIIGDKLKQVVLPLSSSEVKTLKFKIDCTSSVYGKDIPIAVNFDTPDGRTRALTHLEVPHPIEIHPLILDVPGKINYPITIFNHTNEKPSVKLEIYSYKTKDKIYSDTKTQHGNSWQKEISNFEFPLDAGEYTAKVSALGIIKEGKISIKKQTGEVTVSEDDLNGDGIPEIVLENSKIKATLLLFGGRVIEYIVKNRDENLLFKLWPQKPPWAGEPRGVRAFYPYGGLEEFTGYPYIGGHIVFKYEIVEESGIKGQVRLWANIHGSKIDKIITMFGESEILEVRYAMNDIVPSITVIGINPLIEIGPSTGPEDVYYFPAEKLEQRRPVLERYYGDMFFLKEGWAAGYDTEMDISLIVGYPVNDAMFMHLWNNHPNNTPTPYYYTELQPWFKVKPKTTTYFSYYLFGQDGDWKSALENFKQLGILTRVNDHK